MIIEKEDSILVNGDILNATVTNQIMAQSIEKPTLEIEDLLRVGYITYVKQFKIIEKLQVVASGLQTLRTQLVEDF